MLGSFQPKQEQYLFLHKTYVVFVEVHHSHREWLWLWTDQQPWNMSGM